jgi:hypothetical protein
MAKRSTTATINHRQRQREAVELRKAGLTYRQIAEMLGYASEGSAQTSVYEALTALHGDSAKMVLAIHMQQYSTFQALLWTRATRREALTDSQGNPITDRDGNPLMMLANDALPFMDRFLNIMQRQENLLAGAIAEHVTKLADEAVTGTLVIGGDDEASFVEQVKALVERQDRSRDVIEVGSGTIEMPPPPTNGHRNGHQNGHKNGSV